MNKQLCSEKTIQLFNSSPTAYQATHYIVTQLQQAGYQYLDEKVPWSLQLNSKYYTTRNDSALIAFKTPAHNIQSMRITAAHTDSPALKIKLASEKSEYNMRTVHTEVYGGAIHATWFDRELYIAGQIIHYTNNTICKTPVFIPYPAGIISNVAIHLNRDVNQQNNYNPQEHLKAILFGLDNTENTILKACATQLTIAETDILEADLFFIPMQPASITNDFIISGRIDNLSGCYTSYQALIDSPATDTALLLSVLFDNEEIGSRTIQGAESNWLTAIIQRIAQGLNISDIPCLCANSTMISIDAAHGQHPAYANKHDSAYAPLINQGLTIKLNANYRYASNAESAGRFIHLCNAHNISFQRMINRSDIPAGSTIGPLSSSKVGICTVDIGIPLLAMHSTRELAGLTDHYSLYTALLAYYNYGM